MRGFGFESAELFLQSLSFFVEKIPLLHILKGPKNADEKDVQLLIISQRLTDFLQSFAKERA